MSVQALSRLKLKDEPNLGALEPHTIATEHGPHNLLLDLHQRQDSEPTLLPIAYSGQSLGVIPGLPQLHVPSQGKPLPA